jgi:tripartite-type tricarboxylate transporter receptor subunit TctC
VPKGTPTDIIAKLNEAVVITLADPVIRQRLIDLAQEIFPREQQTPEALTSYQGEEIEKWWPIIKAANVSLDDSSVTGSIGKTSPMTTSTPVVEKRE